MKVNRFFLPILALFPFSLFSNTIYFPQVAYGGGYTTTLIIMNTGTTNVSSTLNLYGQTGGLASQTAINIAAGGSTRFTLPNTGPLKVVWGVLAAGTATVQGVATFDLRGNNGVLMTTAGVLGVESGNNFLLPVDITSTASTGIAIANTNAGASVTVGFSLFGEDGSQLAAANDARFSPLGPKGQVADFVTSIFPQLNGTTFKGTLAVSAAAGAPANSLAATALTVKEGLLSALPVIPGTSSGAPGGSSGPSKADLVFYASFSGGGTLQFQGRTFITDGLQAFNNLAPGTYEITGTLPLNGSVLIGFASGGGSFGTGGVVPGSLRSLAGPSGLGTLVSACNVSYINVVSSSQTFRLQFTLTTSTTDACQTGQ